MPTLLVVLNIDELHNMTLLTTPTIKSVFRRLASGYIFTATLLFMVVGAIGVNSPAAQPLELAQSKKNDAVKSSTGDVILTVIHGEEVLRFDDELLNSINWETVKATTDWTDGVQEFRGPLIRDILSQIGIKESKPDSLLVARALDNYEVEISLSEFFEYDTIAALTMNDEKLTRRDKGPLWIVYPSVDYPELAETGNHFKWVWHLFEIEVRL